MLQQYYQSSFCLCIATNIRAKIPSASFWPSKPPIMVLERKRNLRKGTVRGNRKNCVARGVCKKIVKISRAPFISKSYDVVWLPPQWRKVESQLSIKYDNTSRSINVICVSHVRLAVDAVPEHVPSGHK